MTSTVSEKKNRWNPTVAVQKKLALLLLCAQGGITVTGSIVRVTGSGLGCNTWPNCHEGSLVPIQGAAPAIHQAIEFGNRMLTFVLVACVVAVFVAVLMAKRRRELVVHSVIQGVGVIAQAVIGGVSVLLELRWWSVAVHFLPSMVLVWLAAMLYVRIQEPDDVAPVRSYPAALRVLAALCAVGLSVVLITGTMVTGAGPHSGDSGVGMEGRLEVDIDWIAHVHAWTMYTFLAVLALLFASLLIHRVALEVRRIGWMVMVVVVIQALIGIAQYRLGVPRWSVPVHIGMSSVVVAYCSFLFTLGWRRTPKPVA
ncbi:COX15/CtaA family protein [Corynebacterium felinum]|uniref:Cytochrome c oxidase assembly protein subunit 15 n=1 Tax=Corynebacterium felinum TaxID=131318 RepID=A0ABU2BAS8_9CORY|nr:COX15/CtaA family protein [Corynebacterium felinum]MDF5821983.1 COX15/CtaA family protein [Corynebacterium felinum]MDR7355720.1 cytochrome c oxidase assembly protein subunit 15 [Corynebacterium felinum]